MRGQIAELDRADTDGLIGKVRFVSRLGDGEGVSPTDV